MRKERRKQSRRGGDKVLGKTVEILQILEKVSRGENVDYSEDYADLVGMKDELGRRDEDRELGTLLCATIESVANNIDRLLREDRSFRQVRVTKASGKSESQIPTNTCVQGWEAAGPRVGDIYRVYKDDGGVFSTSAVTQVQEDFFQTQNSLYRIEVISS